MRSKREPPEYIHGKNDDRKAQWLAVMAPETTGKMLDKLAVNATPALLERIAEHKNATSALLTALAAHPYSFVRTAVGDNPKTAGAILLQLGMDSDPDVRFHLAENHNIPAKILDILGNDDNPYVAERAKKTLRRLESRTNYIQEHTTEQDKKIEQKKQLSATKDGSVKKLKILVIEDNPSDVKLLEILLAEWPFELQCAHRLSTGLEYLSSGKVDLILLDLSLPDTQGIDTFYQAHCQAPDIPIIVLTGLEDEATGSAAVQAGAQDYLVKGQVLPGLLGRSIKYAIERHQADSKMKQLNLSLERRIIQLAAANHELDRLGKALALSCEQATQASNFKSQFVARITHDIRTPVSAVLAITELLLQKDTRSDDSLTKRLIVLLKESAQCQLTLLTEVLDFSRIEAGKVELQNIEFCPVTLLEDIAELFAASAAKSGVALMTYIDTSLEPVLEGDPIRLHEILVNLTNNALKFTPAGDVVLRALKESEDEEYVTVRFSVSDTGLGMTEQTIKRLFEPFTNSNLFNKASGSGLGLSICKRLVDLMGGEIGAESQEGRGSLFWFSVRLKRSEHLRFQTGAPLNSPVVSIEHKIAGHRDDLRVLVVDHNSTAREITHKYMEAFSKSGRSIRDNTAANAEEALSMLYQAEAKNEPYDVAIVDLESCKPDGFGLAAIVQDDPTLAVTRLIFLTAVDQRQKGALAWSAGFSAYLTKPIKKSNLYDCIAEVVSSQGDAVGYTHE